MLLSSMLSQIMEFRKKDLWQEKGKQHPWNLSIDFHNCNQSLKYHKILGLSLSDAYIHDAYINDCCTQDTCKNEYMMPLCI